MEIGGRSHRMKRFDENFACIVLSRLFGRVQMICMYVCMYRERERKRGRGRFLGMLKFCILGDLILMCWVLDRVPYHEMNSTCTLD